MKLLSQKRKKTANINSEISVFIIRFFIFISLSSIIITLSSFKRNINVDLKTDDVKDTIYVYDTVVYYDTTFVYDTLYISEDEYNSIFNDSVLKLSEKSKFGEIVMQDSNFLLIKKNKKNIRNKINVFSLDFLFSPLYSFQSFNSDYIYQNVSDINKSAVNASIGSNFEVNLNYYKKNNSFTTGLNFTNFRVNFSSLKAKYEIDTIQKIKLLQKTEMFIDSIALINIDTLLATGDTVYYFFKDTTFNSYIDTTYVLEPDTSTAFINEHAKNSYTYIEIPLLYSHNFFTPYFNFSPEFGIITSFFVNSKGKIVSLTDLFQTNNLNNEAKAAYVNLSIYAGIKFNYYITDRFDLITSAYFRRNINSIYRDYPLISHFNSFGINFGIRYKFLF